jgi:hypothetical protein
MPLQVRTLRDAALCGWQKTDDTRFELDEHPNSAMRVNPPRHDLTDRILAGNR